MRRLIPLLLLVLGACAGAPRQGDEQALVDRATLSVGEVLSVENDRLNAATLVRRARGVLVCPRIFRAGFFFGGEGGGCVLVARDAAGSWSSPAFYSLGSGSFGLQAGIQDLQIVLLIMNQRALDAMLDSQLKLGADASVAFASFGGSVEAATTAAVGADILAFARARGLYAGLTLEGTLLSARSSWNRNYYGREVGPRDVVVAMSAHNPGADPLRAALIRLDGPRGPRVAGGASAPAPFGPTPITQAAPRAEVESAPLAPVR